MSFFFLLSCNKVQKIEFSKEALSEKLTTIDGDQMAFQDIIKKHEGETLVIEIWASWCGDCIKAMPKLKELQANNPNAAYVFISMDKTADKWKEGIIKHQIEGDHFMANGQMNGQFGKAIDLNWIPRYIIIDKSGEIVLYNAIETDFEKIDSLLKKLK